MSDFEFDINDYFRKVASGLRIKMLVMKDGSIDDDYIFKIRSLNINLNQPPDKVKIDYENAVRSIELSVAAINNLGIKILIKTIDWCNIKDSHHNINGDKGFFIVKYEKY